MAMVSQIWQQAYTTKEKIGKLDFIKTLKFCASKNTIEKVKRQPKEWEKAFAITSDI